MVSGQIAPPSQADTYQKRQYRLEVRRYIWERRREQCRKRIEISALVIAAFYAGVTFWLAILAREQLTYSERPWVGAGPIDIAAKPTEGQPLTVKITLLNSGRSPAVHLISSAILNPVMMPRADYGSRIPFIDDPSVISCSTSKPRWNDELGGSILLPGATNQSLNLKSPLLNKTVINIITSTSQTVFPNDKSLEDIPRTSAPPSTQQWALGLYLVGCFDYFDEFHKAHRTSFCYFYAPSEIEPKGVFNGCAKGNEAE